MPLALALCEFFNEGSSQYDMEKLLYAFIESTVLITLGVTAILSFLLLLKLALRRKVDLEGKHVVITGGSSGIGKEVACEVAKRGAHVTIVARSQEKLDLALRDIFQAVIKQQQRIQTISMDVSKSYKEIKEKIEGAEKEAGPVFMLVNCAGTALCGVLDDLTEEQIRSQVEVNCIGSILPTKAVLASMKKEKRGHIVLVASQAAYCGIYGFTAYSASKFALRGFAEALNMELGPYNVKVTVAYPPDTDTPGFHEEQKTKPLETKLISDTSGLLQSDYVANKIVTHALAGQFSSNMGVDGFLLEHLCSGMSPMDSLFDSTIQILSLNFLRCVALGFGYYFRHIIKKCHIKKLHDKENKKQD